MHEELKQQLCEAGRILTTKGLVECFGHVSARLPGETKFYITTRGALAFTRPEDIETVSFSGEKLTKNSPDGAPNEVFLHAAVYQACDDVQAIARTQSPWCEVFGIRLEGVRPVHDFGAILMGETGVLDLPTLGDAHFVGEALVRELAGKNAILLRGNGNVVLGGSVPEAVVRAVFLDESARLQYQARALGKDGVRYFSSEEVQFNGTALSRPDRIDRAWKNWLRLSAER